ncbi:hypothetical protein EYF80_048474 [Liparis tanakae]|uniref:Uncharacterized protein n=1 Tax=Liparis tanakae TaxID=230148 RepID=A0A4Z2FK66_9TELE|nr:hypothetical protein EYF80_048474 [Liparis tanakae]
MRTRRRSSTSTSVDRRQPGVSRRRRRRRQVTNMSRFWMCVTHAFTSRIVRMKMRAPPSFSLSTSSSSSSTHVTQPGSSGLDCHPLTRHVPGVSTSGCQLSVTRWPRFKIHARGFCSPTGPGSTGS